MTWRNLDTGPLADLRDARLQLHHAAQIVASAGITLLDPTPDDSHPNLGWDEPLAALMGRALPSGGMRVGLRLHDLSLIVVDASNEIKEELSLDGRTLDDGYAWLASTVEQAGAKLPPGGVVRSSYEIPSHATGEGGAFSGAGRTAFEELAHWFANGHEALLDLAARMPGASDVRCWPHHFDIGSLVTVATHDDGSLASSIGLGFSPGDESYDEPYFYVSPWPYPEPTALPPLDRHGTWHTEGFTSAILTGSDLLDGPPESQGGRLHEFLDDAVDKSGRVLANGAHRGLDG